MKNVGFVPELGVTDVRSASLFYQRCLGFSEIEVVKQQDGEAIWVELGLDSARLMCQQIDLLADEIPGVSPRKTAPTAIHVLRVNSRLRAAELFDRAESLGVVIAPLVETDYGSSEFSIQDPDGHILLIAGRD
jgi:uncharacterized glyoxalase superfamily protein PhnB